MTKAAEGVVPIQCKYGAKYGICVCRVTPRVCFIHDMTQKVFYIGQATPPSVLYWFCDSNSVLYSEYRTDGMFDPSTQILY